MSSAMQVSMVFMTAAVAVAMFGCSDEPSGSGAPTASHSAAAPPATSTPVATASAPAPTATASAPAHDCPKGSTGEGSLKAPCDAKGAARMMEATWTGKMTDGGPSFRVTNKSQSTILYGKIVVYFYDKAGKQLEVMDGATPPKSHPNHTCSGNLFGGVMKPGEKAVVTFSCVEKKHVPDGAAAIEGELQLVGFADQSEKKSEYYWRNNDLTPDTRPKGGVK
jgi:hypothetical protein